MKRPAAAMLAIEDGAVEEQQEQQEQQEQKEQQEQPEVQQPEKTALQAGRKPAGPKLSGTERVAFSRWCQKQSVSLKDMDSSQIGEIKSAWLVNPAEAKSRVVTSTTQQLTKTKSGASESWMTAAAIAKEENLDVGSAELQELIAQLPKKSSRYKHLAQDSRWDEYEYVGFSTKKRQKERSIGTRADVSTGELQESELAEIQDVLASSSSKGPDTMARSSKASKPKTPKVSSAAGTLKSLGNKLMKFLDELKELVVKGEAESKKSPWMEGIVKKCIQDRDALQEAAKDLFDLVVSGRGTDAEADVWKGRVDELCVRTPSHKLLKQAWLQNACDVMVAPLLAKFWGKNSLARWAWPKGPKPFFLKKSLIWKDIIWQNGP